MSIQTPHTQDGTDPIRPLARDLTLEHADLLPPFVGFDEWSAAADVVERNLADAIRQEVRA